MLGNKSAVQFSRSPGNTPLLLLLSLAIMMFGLTRGPAQPIITTMLHNLGGSGQNDSRCLVVGKADGALYGAYFLKGVSGLFR